MLILLLKIYTIEIDEVTNSTNECIKIKFIERI